MAFLHRVVDHAPQEKVAARMTATPSTVSRKAQTPAMDVDGRTKRFDCDRGRAALRRSTHRRDTAEVAGRGCRQLNMNRRRERRSWPPHPTACSAGSLGVVVRSG